MIWSEIDLPSSNLQTELYSFLPRKDPDTKQPLTLILIKLTLSVLFCLLPAFFFISRPSQWPSGKSAPSEPVIEERKSYSMNKISDHQSQFPSAVLTMAITLFHS